jgi:hypothetical protein
MRNIFLSNRIFIFREKKRLCPVIRGIVKEQGVLYGKKIKCFVHKLCDWNSFERQRKTENKKRREKFSRKFEMDQTHKFSREKKKGNLDKNTWGTDTIWKANANRKRGETKTIIRVNFGIKSKGPLACT